MIQLLRPVLSAAFVKAFSKGLIPSGFLVGGFCLWASMGGNSYQEHLKEQQPFVVIPITYTNPESHTAPDSQEKTPPPHHQEQEQEQEQNHATASAHPSDEMHETQTHNEQPHTQTHDTPAHDAPPHAPSHTSPAAHDGTSEPHAQDPHAPTAAIPHVKLHEEELVEHSKYGLLPHPRVTDGVTPFDSYRKKGAYASTSRGKAVLQILLGPVGLSVDLAQKIAKTLPPEVSILLSPYAASPDEIMAIFKESGHEVWLYVPTETAPVATYDTGPLSLRADFSADKNLEMLKKVMASTTGYTGLFLMNADQTTLSLSSARMQDILSDPLRRGVGLAYSAAEPLPALTSLGGSPSVNLRWLESRRTPLPALMKDLDAQLSPDHPLLIQLRPYPAEIETLAAWLKTLQSGNVSLAPISFDSQNQVK
ncbi:MAG: divergent polysaccharide deacetylase family protein [Rhodospirillales bacterium]|nr:divergent polysaccharide deacetylase family protein [Rhodospirillales bacterium]